jgi:maleylpyruvate isomerase
MTSEEVEGRREHCRMAHERLHRTVESLTDAEASRPSLLPGWTVAHVLTHLEQNGESVLRRLRAAADGELVDQYPGGPAGRAAGIESGARRPARQIVAALIAVDDEVDRSFTTAPPALWSRPVRTGDGGTAPATVLLFSRWREVETHHVDLGLGHGPRDWPVELVDAWLPGLLSGLADRTDPRRLMAWALGRGGPPELAPWG